MHAIHVVIHVVVDEVSVSDVTDLTADAGATRLVRSSELTPPLSPLRKSAPDYAPPPLTKGGHVALVRDIGRSAQHFRSAKYQRLLEHRAAAETTRSAIAGASAQGTLDDRPSQVMTRPLPRR
jgi:hypothetical protein